jgi:hypothetical protein
MDGPVMQATRLSRDQPQYRASADVPPMLLALADEVID